MCMASEGKEEVAFHVNYKLIYGRDLQNMFNITNAPTADDSRVNWDVYVVGSITEGNKKMKRGRRSVEMKFSSQRQKTLRATSRGWVSVVKPLFFLVRLGSYKGELADLDVGYEVSILMNK